MKFDGILGEGRQDEAGFTLIDMLVALVLFSLMAALLTGTIATARRALGFIELANATTPVSAAQNYLHSALIQARSKPRVGNADDTQLSFTGDQESMSFITSYVPRGQFDGLYHVKVELEPSPGRRDTYNLVVIQTLDRPTATDQSPPLSPTLRSVLIENVSAAAFSYFGATEEQNSFQWQDRWSQLYRLPALVAIEVQFAKGDNRVWHRLNIPIYASDSSAVPCPPRASCF